MKRLTAPPTTERGRPPDIAKRKPKACGVKRIRRTDRNPRSRKPGSRCFGTWDCDFPGCGDLGPSNSSERGHVMDMLNREIFPKKTIFCGDAGFVGYPLWSCIVNSGADFLVRVGANVSLLRDSAHYSLEKNGIVLCWPRAMMQSGQPPLRLRLVKIRLGKTTAWMLTSVLDPAKLTNKQMIRFYKMRWGMELEFRGLKQTLDRSRLRCRNEKRLMAELSWSIMAMAVAELFALKEQLSSKQTQAAKASATPDPVKRSLAKTMRAIRRCIRQPHQVPATHNNLQTRCETPSPTVINGSRTSAQGTFRPILTRNHSGIQKSK